MFGRNAKSAIDSLIGISTRVDGNVYFRGGLRIDGEVHGNVIADAGETSVLIVSQHGRICGELRCANMVINGQVVGPVYASELLELQPSARIVGDVYYKLLEMHGGALVSGQLTHQYNDESPLHLALSEA
ncbi:MAG: polymer-forming cytoskeletal protein [Pseudomonadota bacterium]